MYTANTSAQTHAREMCRISISVIVLRIIRECVPFCLLFWTVYSLGVLDNSINTPDADFKGTFWTAEVYEKLYQADTDKDGLLTTSTEWPEFLKERASLALLCADCSISRVRISGRYSGDGRAD